MDHPSASPAPIHQRGNGHRYHCSPELPVLHWQGGGVGMQNWQSYQLSDTTLLYRKSIYSLFLLLSLPSSSSIVQSWIQPKHTVVPPVQLWAPRTAVWESWRTEEESLPSRLKPPTPLLLFTTSTHSHHPLFSPCREGSLPLPPKVESPSYVFTYED